MKIRLWALALALCLLTSLLPARAQAEEIDVPVDKNAVLSGLYEADIASLREAMDLGFITSRELTAYYLDRIEKYNAPYDCFITICEDALIQADARDAQAGSQFGRIMSRRRSEYPGGTLPGRNAAPAHRSFRNAGHPS